MNGWMLFGTVAISALLVIYQYYQDSHREQERAHGQNRGRTPSRPDAGDEQENRNTTNTGPSQRKKPKLPGADDPCVICQELLIDPKARQQYVLIALHPCQHWFHKTCAIRLADYNELCPVCRVRFDKTKL